MALVVTYEITSGAIPPGLTFTVNGNEIDIDGAPTDVGTVDFTVHAVDEDSGTTADRNYTLTVGTISIDPKSLPDGTTGISYVQNITATGGTGPITVSYLVTGGSIPAGITFTPSGPTLAIDGNPSSAGNVAFTVTATDDSGDSASQGYEITVNRPGLTVRTVDSAVVIDSVNTLITDNTAGNKAFGRITTSKPGDGMALLDWQGIQIYQAGIGYKGPEPDIELVDTSTVAWAVEDDAEVSRLVLKATATGLVVATKNTDNTASVATTSVILANNSAGTRAFGRIVFTNSGNTNQLDWQGLRLYQEGVGYKGPQPDILLVSTASLAWTIDEDVLDQRVIISGTAVANVGTRNTDNTSLVPATSVILANNNLGTAAFGRIRFTNSGTQNQLDWQGLRVYREGVGFTGPRPDIQLVSTPTVVWAVADDPNTNTIAISAVAQTAALSFIGTANNDATAQLPLTKNIIANNVPGGPSYARVQFAVTAANTTTISWQGFQVYVEGVGFSALRPDLQLVNSPTITWGVADDPATGTTAITASAVLAAISFIGTINNDQTAALPITRNLVANNTPGGPNYARVQFVVTAANTATISWQGFAVLTASSGFSSLLPDLEFKDTETLKWSCAPNLGSNTNAVTGTVSIGSRNQDGTQSLISTIVFIANNTEPTAAWGRIIFTKSNAAGSCTIDWQGFYVYSTSNLDAGPYPDLHFTDTAGAKWLVAGDNTNNWIDLQLQLQVFGASGPGHSSGIVPDPGATAGTSRFLREDATWVMPLQLQNVEEVVSGAVDTLVIDDRNDLLDVVIVAGVGTLSASLPITTLGDLLYYGTGYQRLPGNPNTIQTILTQTGNGTTSAAPAWQTLQMILDGVAGHIGAIVQVLGHAANDTPTWYALTDLLKQLPNYNANAVQMLGHDATGGVKWYDTGTC